MKKVAVPPLKFSPRTGNFSLLTPRSLITSPKNVGQKFVSRSITNTVNELTPNQSKWIGRWLGTCAGMCFGAVVLGK